VVRKFGGNVNIFKNIDFSNTCVLIGFIWFKSITRDHTWKNILFEYKKERIDVIDGWDIYDFHLTVLRFGVSYRISINKKI
jgi:hypothetical protein